MQELPEIVVAAVALLHLSCISCVEAEAMLQWDVLRAHTTRISEL